MSSAQYTADKLTSLDNSLPKTRIWIVSDGRPGHVSQLEGIARGLGEQNTQIKWVEAKNASKLTRKQRFKDSDGEQPDIVIGAGHTTHRRVLNIARVYEAMSCIIMSPSLPKLLFDCLICPAHDEPKTKSNVLVTQGTINKVTSQPPKPINSTNHAGILLGGPSKHFAWDQKVVIQQLEVILNYYPDKHWQVFTSRRTPENLIESLTPFEQTHRHLQVHDVNDPDTPPIEECLNASSMIWTSPDSASMVYESLTAGCPTGILSLTPNSKRRPSKLARSVLQLTKSGWLNSYESWLNSKQFFMPPKALDEGQRASKWLLQFYETWRASNIPDDGKHGKVKTASLPLSEEVSQTKNSNNENASL